MDIQITAHFKLSEFLKSSYISSMGPSSHRTAFLDEQENIDYGILHNLYRLCVNVLEPLRQSFGKRIRINSGYRCRRLNRCVGGVADSQHLLGLAADITSDNNADLLSYLLLMNFDQLICYGSPDNPRFIHVSYVSADANRNQVLYKP